MILITSPRFAEHVPPPGHPERPERYDALTQAGYRTAINIADGFEGDMDEDGHRGNRNGWKQAELPWRQG